MSVKEEKAALRARFLDARRRMDRDEKARLDHEIALAAFENVRYRTSKTLLAYASMPHEVDTWEILDAAWADGRPVALPRCGADGKMDFFLVAGRTGLTTGKWNVSEPNDLCPLYVPNADDLCLVPGLAFDDACFRLGHGGGYYDRYLALHPIPTLGLCYPDCRVKRLPKEPFDIRISSVLFGTFLLGGAENA